MPEEKLSGKTPVLRLWTRHSPPTTNFLSLSSLLISTLPFNTFPAALGGSAGQRDSLESLQSETWMLPSITALLIKPQAADLLKWLTKTIFKTKWKALYQTIKAASRRSELRVISNLNTFPEHAGISETVICKHIQPFHFWLFSLSVLWTKGSTKYLEEKKRLLAVAGTKVDTLQKPKPQWGNKLNNKPSETQWQVKISSHIKDYIQDWRSTQRGCDSIISES